MISDVTIILLIYKEQKYLHLLRNVCEGIANQTYSSKVLCIFDVHTPVEELELVKAYHFDEYLCAPKEMTDNPAMKHIWAYNQCQSKYVAFNQSDDQSFISRINIQRNILEENPDIGLIASGFFYMEEENLNKVSREMFRICEPCGLNVGYPSCWMLNKNIIRKLPVLSGFHIQCAWEWDPWLLLGIMLQYPVIFQRQPLVIYQQHQNNFTNLLPASMEQNRFKELCFYWKNIKEKIIYPKVI